MPNLLQHLELDKCPHCHVDTPSLPQKNKFETQPTSERNPAKKIWAIYACSRCGGVVSAWSQTNDGPVIGVFPKVEEVSTDIDSPAREYLKQAIDSLHAPSGAQMLAASSVDAMLKIKGFKKGSLYSRIDEAKEKHLITEDMAAWAHDVRLDAKDQRHVNEEATLPSASDAQRCTDFVRALGEVLFVLPAKVKRGRSKN